MTMKHTSGPWRIAYSPGVNEATIFVRTRHIATVEEFMTDEGLDNTHLIRTAPELLEACQKVCAISAEMTEAGREAAFGLRLFEAVKDVLTKVGVDVNDLVKQRALAKQLLDMLRGVNAQGKMDSMGTLPTQKVQ